ncbi:MAG TPA: PDDEXK nuclease domain-containing protein [Gemmataceae bacterium]|nr:PDDEXK nuclease domain-containing protein [Gemmataceae bacterium]
MAQKRSTPPDKPGRGRSLPVPHGYADFLRDLKERIRNAQIKAALSVNHELLALYWHIGKNIVERQQTEGWGTAVIDRLGKDLQAAFPGISGFSRPNVYRMRAFYLAHAGAGQVVSQAARQSEAGPPEPMASLPWFHNVILIEKIKDPAERVWYARKCLEHGWSRPVLDHHIDTGLYLRQGKALTNFERTLPPPHSDLARDILKNPYNFDFLTLADDAQERELERGLLEHIRDFLLELGVGFAFVGSQVHLEIGGNDFYIDLLFYHLKLRAYIVIDIKMISFQPEFAGKINFYLSVVDDLLRHPDDKPSIGLILCKAGNQVVAEYALRDIAKPVGVSNYVTKLTETLPSHLQSSLPTVADLEAELRAVKNAAETKEPPKRPRRRSS